MISLSEVILTVHKQLLVVFEALTAGIEGRRMFFFFFLLMDVHCTFIPFDFPGFCVLAGSSSPCPGRAGAGGADISLLWC